MPKDKSVDVDKIKKEYLKGTLSQQIEAHQVLGEWLHQEIQSQQEELSVLERKMPKNGNQNIQS